MRTRRRPRLPVRSARAGDPRHGRPVLSVPRSVVASVLAGLTACGGGPVQHTGADGPLAVIGSGGGGGASVYPPGVEPWRASFGFNLLCRKTDGEIVLRGVRWQARVEARNVTPMLRSLVDSEVTDGFLKESQAPFYSASGSPPDWSEPYSDKPVGTAGEYTSEIAGAKVDRACAQPRDPAAGYTDLVLVVEAGREGAHLDRYFVDYTVDGDDRTLRVDQTVILCGTEVSRRYCRGAQS